MPHVALVPFTGFRVREDEVLALGMTLPGLKPRAAAVAQLPALGLLTLAGLNPPHWTCSYHEATRADEALADVVMQHRPAVVALSALTASVEEAYRFSALLRARGARTVLGGLHATACPDEARGYCDAVVIGDGEPVWPQLLADAERGELRPVYRAAVPFDLAGAPVPRFDLLGRGPRPRFTVQTQRGCPLACEFCGASRLLGPYRSKPVANVARELDALRALDPRPVLELADDNTFAGRDAGELLDVLGAADARYFTEVDWRAGEVPGLPAKLAASGCVQVLVGIESLCFRHPGMGPKQAELPRIMAALEAIQGAGVAVIGCFIVGGDGETHDSLDRLAEFIASGTLADVQLTLQTPFPGTALRRRLEREGRLLPNRGWSHCTLFDLTYRPDAMSVGELESAFRDLARRVFGASESARRGAIRRRVWQTNPRLRPCDPEHSASS
ncbi:MAG: B12-binding domain-containing radical SAM protein [Planctomycetes bacterium]|nr:B12-binding domain-containing radical SAM protein [Planctomycetota bacterium]